MIVSTYRPYFSPFPGFFVKAMLSDVFVLLDSVQYPRGGSFVNRNRFKNDQGVLWMTIPVWKKGLGLQRIEEVRVCGEGRWAEKFLSSLQNAYGKTPFFRDHLPFLQEIFSDPPDRLLDLNLRIIRHIMTHLDIRTRVVLLSELHIQEREPGLSVAICRKLGGAQFLAQRSARKFLPGEGFRRAGIQLRFFAPRPLVYPQLWGGFIPNLSALDLLFTCGAGARRIMEKDLPA
jgi:WbqC-like protein family